MFDLVYGHGALYGCYFTNHINYVLEIVVNRSPLSGDYSTATNWSFSVSRVVKKWAVKLVAVCILMTPEIERKLICNSIDNSLLMDNDILEVQSHSLSSF